MPFEIGILLIVGVIAIVLGYMEFKFHPLVGVVTQIVAFLVLLGVFLSAINAPSFVNWFTANAFMTYVTIIALGLAIGNSAAEVF